MDPRGSSAFKMLFEGENQQEIGKWTEYWLFCKKKICPCTGVKYHNIQICLLVYEADLRWAFTGPLVLCCFFLIQFYVPFKIISAHMRRANQ